MPSAGRAHWLIMWGCLLAVGHHLPAGLRLGPLRDRAGRPRDRIASYVFGFPTSAFRIESVLGFLIFHGLVWASFLVIAGVMLAMRRRMREHGAAALQQFGEDILPLILLFAISVTGLMLDGELHVDEGVRLRLPGDPACDHGDLHAALAAVRQVLPHLPAAGPARRRLLQGRRARQAEQAQLPPLRRAVRVADCTSRT